MSNQNQKQIYVSDLVFSQVKALVSQKLSEIASKTIRHMVAMSGRGSSNRAIVEDLKGLLYGLALEDEDWQHEKFKEWEISDMKQGTKVKKKGEPMTEISLLKRRVNPSIQRFELFPTPT